MKYYKYWASGPNVCSNLEFKIQIEEDPNETVDEFNDYLDELGYDYCVENWESYGNSISEYEEENDFEWEANFSWEELNEEEFNECDLQEYFL